jgi:hypothetical protein
MKNPLFKNEDIRGSHGTIFVPWAFLTYSLFPLALWADAVFVRIAFQPPHAGDHSSIGRG